MIKQFYILLLIYLILSFSCNSDKKRNSYKKKDTVNIVEYGTGLILSEEKYSEVPLHAPLTRSLYAAVPTEYSLKEYIPEPLSQGQYGTCVGWASSNARTILYAKGNNIKGTKNISNIRFSPGFIYHNIKLDKSGCTNGSYIEDAMYLLKNEGVVKLSNLSELCPTSIDPFVKSQAAKYKIDNYTRLFDYVSSGNDRIQAIKKSISEGNPVVFGMKTPPSFHTCGEVWTPSESSSGSYGGHAMCLIGYDDNKFGGAFEILNSWGDAWGSNGLTWIRYNDFAQFVHTAFEIADNIKPTPNPTPDPEDTDPDFVGHVEFITENNITMPVNFFSDNGLDVVTNEEVISFPNSYRMATTYSSGTKFRLYITNNKPAYVYAIASDRNNRNSLIFPYNENISPLLNYASNQIAIPDEEHYIMMDNVVGADYFCLLYSNEEIDISALISHLDSNRGQNFFDTITGFLGEKIIQSENISFEKNKVSFSAFSDGKSVLPVFVVIPHN